jgi:uncharacterized membrane protein
MIEVVLLSREYCHLCDEAIEYLNFLQDEIPHKLKIIDIDKDLGLKKQYGSVVPVVEFGTHRLISPFSRQDLRMRLLDVQNNLHKRDPQIQSRSSTKKRKETWSKADDFTLWFSKHYLAVFNILVLIYLGLPFLAPVFSKAGAERPAKLIYGVYGIVCHQLSFRSIFLFGEQHIYPRATVGLEGVESFSQATGLGEGNSAREIFSARAYHGDERIGYKVALCQRDIAIYGAILLFGIIYGLSGKRLKPLPWYLWLIIGIVPIGLDGVSQIISQPPFNLFAYRESTPFLRILTGALFGFTTAWFGYPLVEETMVDTRTMMTEKYQRTHPVLAEIQSEEKSQRND